MPLYDYRCDHCGNDFSALRRMSEASEDMACDCGEMAARIISAPYLALMDRNTRIASQRNEKSAHEPRQARRSSCGCSGTHTCNTTSGEQKSSADPSSKSANGNGLKMQTKKTARPWMLGH